MSELSRRVEEKAAQTGFAGVVRLERSGGVAFDAAYGLADRGHGIAMTTDSQLGMASGSKTFTALVVLRLMEQGLLGLSTTARQVLGNDLPRIADDVTIEHLLSTGRASAITSTRNSSTARSTCCLCLRIGW